MTEKIELIITTNIIPNSLKPIKRIEKGTHAMLGNDSNPAENEFSVFPNPLNLIIEIPISVPRDIETRNPTISLPKVTPILSGKERLEVRLTKELVTMAGDGSDILGQMPNMNTICHIPMKIDKSRAALAASSRLCLDFLKIIFSLIYLIFYSCNNFDL